MKNIAAIIILLICFSTNTHFAQTKRNPIITFEKTPCFGACPVYKLEIYSNRKMMLTNTKYVKAGEGNFSGKLSRKDYKVLIEKFHSARFTQLEDQYHTKQVSDLPTKYLSLSEEGKTKTVMDYIGAPESLTQLEEYLQQLVDNTEWKKIKSK